MGRTVSLFGAIVFTTLVFVFITVLINNNPARITKNELSKTMDLVIVEKQKPQTAQKSSVEPAPPNVMQLPKMRDLSSPQLSIPKQNLEPSLTAPVFQRPKISAPGLGSVAKQDADSEAVPTLRIEPIYPRKLLRNGVEGTVKLKFTVATDGSVVNIVVLEANPKRVFDRAAIQTISKWKFRPKMVEGKAVETILTQEIEFKINK